MLSERRAELRVYPIKIDKNTLPLLVLMVIGTTAPGRWDDVTIARLFDIPPSEAGCILEDLEDWEMINVGLMGCAITYRGTQHLKIYMPGGVVPRG